MRKDIRAWLAGAACAAVVSVSCSKVETCSVSPVEIEELREDISIIDKDLAGVNERAQALADDLAAKQADLDSKKDKPAQLRARLEQLKRGSGRIEKKAPETKKAPAKSGEQTGGASGDAGDSKESS